MSLRIGIDVDGVLADNMSTVAYIMNHNFGTHYRKENFSNWRTWHNELFGLEEKDIYKYLDQAWHDGGAEIGTEESSVNIMKAIRRMSKIGRVIVITRRTPTSWSDMTRWISRRDWPINDLVMVGKGGSKFDYNLDYLIDDKPSLINDRAKARSDTTILLRDQPWNQTLELDKGFYSENFRRIHTLSEAATYIEARDSVTGTS